MRRLFYYYLYLFLVWGGFRYFVRLPDVIEELWFKPVIWLAPLFWWNLSLGTAKKVKMFGSKWAPSIILGLIVGVFYFVLLRKGNLSFPMVTLDTLGVILATAIVEELTLSGFVAGYLDLIKKGSVWNIFLVGLMGALLRIPILLFVYGVGGMELLGVLLFAASSGMVNAWIRLKTGNVVGSVVARIGISLSLLG